MASKLFAIFTHNSAELALFLIQPTCLLHFLLYRATKLAPKAPRGGREGRRGGLHEAAQEKFSLATHLDQTRMLSGEVLKVDSELSHGQVRRVDEDMVQDLLNGFMMNEPEELTLTVTKDQGMPPPVIVLACVGFGYSRNGGAIHGVIGLLCMNTFLNDHCILLCLICLSYIKWVCVIPLFPCLDLISSSSNSFFWLIIAFCMFADWTSASFGHSFCLHHQTDLHTKQLRTPVRRWGPFPVSK